MKPLEWSVPHRSQDCFLKMITVKSQKDRVVGFHIASPVSKPLLFFCLTVFCFWCVQSFFGPLHTILFESSRTNIYRLSFSSEACALTLLVLQPVQLFCGIYKTLEPHSIKNMLFQPFTPLTFSSFKLIEPPLYCSWMLKGNPVVFFLLLLLLTLLLTVLLSKKDTNLHIQWYCYTPVWYCMILYDIVTYILLQICWCICIV